MSLQGSKIRGAGCGCGMSGGSGYGVKLGSSAMLLGPQSGYGAVDPYKAGIVNSGSSLSYPALDTKARRGGKKSRSRKSSSSKRVFFNIKSKSKKSKKLIKSKKNSSRKIRHKSSKRRNIKKQMKQKGGDLSFSDYMPSSSAPASPQVGQIASSPNYGVNVSELSPKMSALASPVRVTPGNNCSK